MIAPAWKRIGPSLPATVRALADKLFGRVEPSELVAGICVGILVLRRSGHMRSARWLWHVATREELLASRAHVATDGARTLREVGVSEADA
jgi:hypothetical protein